MRKRTHDEFLEAVLPSLDLVYNLARRLVDAPEVDDLVQETFTRAFDAWTRGRRPRKVEPWIATICLNTGRSWMRRASHRYEIPTAPDPTVSAADDVASEAEASVLVHSVHQALWQLPEEQRIAVTLMDLNGFTASQIASMTKSPRGTVLARAHRARKKLARLLRKEVMQVDA